MNFRFSAIALCVCFAACGNSTTQSQTTGSTTPSDKSAKQAYVASTSATADAFCIDDDSVYCASQLTRGTLLNTYPKKARKIGGIQYVPVEAEEGHLYLRADNLVDALAKSVQESQMYVRTAASVVDSLHNSHISHLVKKGSRVSIVGFDSLCPDGKVHRYLVEQDGKRGFVFAKYLVSDSLSAQLNYQASYYDSIHSRVKNQYGAGEAIGCDFYPVERPVFSHTMPNPVYALYLNIGAVGRIDSFIDLAKQTRINAIVIDLKDNECPGYPAETFRRYSPTNLKWGGNSRRTELYEYAVRRLHEEGLYAIGRITVFKDTYFVRDNPEVAITERETGQPFYHNKAHWPSAFDRRVWQFNVCLAREAVRRFGFDEINFDYVRFPDRMQSVADRIDYHNTYDESMVQAIQRFVQYATDEIHLEGAYVSIDVFGESANKGYTTAYGQYWPAISNVADAICAMPYPDHFAPYSYGIKDPWNHPYHTLTHWGERAAARQRQCPTPAVPRTWIQAYHVLKYVDRNGIDYDAHNIMQEVRALFDAGLTGGYTTWLSNSSLSRYRSQKAAFSVDYVADHRQRNEAKQNAADTTKASVSAQ